MQKPEPLLTMWLADADKMARYGSEDIANALRRCASDLDEYFGSSQSKLLRPREAARVSGYSAAHLRRLGRSGALTNLGTPARPMFAEAELPKKPGGRTVARDASRDDTRSALRDIVTSKYGSTR